MFIWMMCYSFYSPQITTRLILNEVHFGEYLLSLLCSCFNKYFFLIVFCFLFFSCGIFSPFYSQLRYRSNNILGRFSLNKDPQVLGEHVNQMTRKEERKSHRFISGAQISDFSRRRDNVPDQGHRPKVVLGHGRVLVLHQEFTDR